MSRIAITATFLALAVADSSAEGVIFVPGQGWRAAPCCRENGYPGLQGVPPREFTHGPMAPAFWGEIVPRIVERVLPPALPTPPGAMYDYRGPRPPYGQPPAPRDMRPPLPGMRRSLRRPRSRSSPSRY